MAPPSERLGSMSPGMRRAAAAEVADARHHKDSMYHHNSHQGGYLAWGFLVFVVLVLIIWLILVAVNPTWIQKTDSSGNSCGEVDHWKALLWAVVIAFIIIVIMWLVHAVSG